jgi:bifunctional non-homologous end joining protein LigD
MIRPMLATAAPVLPTGHDWTYEVKWDGYRVLAVKAGLKVQLISRNQKDLTRDYPTVVSELAALKVGRVVLDGEIVALDADGRPSFQALQHRRAGAHAVSYYAFDVLQVEQDSRPNAHADEDRLLVCLHTSARQERARPEIRSFRRLSNNGGTAYRSM